MDVKQALDDVSGDIDKIADPTINIVITKLLNIIEELATENKQFREEIQNLRDENNRLKGEQGKPGIRPQSGHSINISSEKERKKGQKKKNKKSKKKKHKIKIDRVEVCEFAKEQLPADAVFKGYQAVVVQDII